MKNAMKKLMAFALVAVMLVGVLPFGAFALEEVESLTPNSGNGNNDGIMLVEELVEGIVPGGDEDDDEEEEEETPAAPKKVTTVYLYADNTLMHGKEFEVYSGITPAALFETYKASSSYMEGSKMSAVTDMDGKIINGEIWERGVKLFVTRCAYNVTLKLIVDGETTMETYNGLTEADADAQWDEAVATPADLAEIIDSDVTAEDYTIVFDWGKSSKNGTNYVIVLTATSKETVIPGDNGADLIIPGGKDEDDYISDNDNFGNNGGVNNGGSNNGSNNNGSNNNGSNNNGSNNNGSNNDGSNKPTGEYAYAYIYVGNSNSAAKIYKNEQAFSIAAVVDKFDTADTAKHYAFDYYILEGSTDKETDDTDVVQVGQTAHIYVKVTESKLNHNKVYLQIFMNNNFDVPAKTINVTTTATENGLYLNGNVKDLILDYFSAKNSLGIKIDGMYPSTGSWVAKFLEDNKVKNVSADDVIAMKEDDYVVFNIMVTNAKLASSSTADSSNPKTGDQIFAPVAIMAVSACALAAVAFYLNKKRAV